MARTCQALAASVCAVVVLGAAGCSSSDSGSEKPAKGKSGSSSTEGSGGDGSGTEGGKDAAKQKTPNGVEKLSASDTVEKAVTATDAAPTKRVTGSDALDLTIDDKGNCAGTVTITPSNSHEVLRKKDQVWAKPKNEAAYYATPEGKALLKAVPDAKGKYMQGTMGQSMSLSILAAYCEVGQIGKNLKPVKATKVGKSTVNGRNAVSVKVSTGKDDTILHIATEGEPYILKMTDPKDGMEMLLSEFGTSFTPPATPPAAQTYDGAKAEEAMMGAGMDAGAS